MDEFTVRLKFGGKKDRTSADKFYQTSKKDECVICGTKKQLIKYYIVPQCYRKHFPIEIKSHSSHDIVLLCHDLHQASQQKEGILRRRLCKLYGIEDLNKRLNLDKILVNISKAAKTYIHNKDNDTSIHKDHKLHETTGFIKCSLIRLDWYHLKSLFHY